MAVTLFVKYEMPFHTQNNIFYFIYVHKLVARNESKTRRINIEHRSVRQAAVEWKTTATTTTTANGIWPIRWGQQMNESVWRIRGNTIITMGEGNMQSENNHDFHILNVITIQILSGNLFSKCEWKCCFYGQWQFIKTKWSSDIKILFLFFSGLRLLV